jgi:hypothetical protein
MSDPKAELRIAELRLKVRRLRNLLRLQDGVEPPTEQVPASDARALGTACLYRAQGLRGSMPLSSYDRPFPNQDTIPKDGAGKLIAAPLQGRGRKRGTSGHRTRRTARPAGSLSIPATLPAAIRDRSSV